MHSDLDITAPVYVGDTISVVVEVTEARPSKSGGRGVVTTRNIVVNQRDETVLTYQPGSTHPWPRLRSSLTRVQ